jgi:hypothetical protein
MSRVRHQPPDGVRVSYRNYWPRPLTTRAAIHSGSTREPLADSPTKSQRSNPTAGSGRRRCRNRSEARRPGWSPLPPRPRSIGVPAVRPLITPNRGARWARATTRRARRRRNRRRGPSRPPSKRPRRRQRSRVGSIRLLGPSEDGHACVRPAGRRPARLVAIIQRPFSQNLCRAVPPSAGSPPPPAHGRAAHARLPALPRAGGLGHVVAQTGGLPGGLRRRVLDLPAIGPGDGGRAGASASGVARPWVRHGPGC